jgi:uncharacterized protein
MPTYDTPGVYIEEQTGPGVIAGVGTSTVAFIGPARNGVLREAVRISSYDEFLQNFALLQPDGSFDPHITTPRWFYLGLAVRGYFDNGGRQAFVVRVGTANATTWSIDNQGGQEALRLQAATEGVAGDAITVEVQAANATGSAGRAAVRGSATVTNVAGTTVTVNDGTQFRAGDWVTEDESARARVDGITGNDLQLSATIAALANGDTLRIAHLVPAQRSVRVASTAGIWPGSIVLIRGRNPADSADVQNYALVESVDAAGFVTFADAPPRTETFNLAVAAAPVLISQEFRLLITAGGSTETLDNLSLEPAHPRYVFAVTPAPAAVRIRPPQAIPTTTGYPARLVAPLASVPIAVNGVNDDPGALTSAHFQAGLDVLRDIDDVNILCIPDAAAHAERVTIQQAMIQHCISPGLKDRFAILDVGPGAPPSGPGSAEEQRQGLESPNGFAALYYPWLTVRNPLSKKVPPDTMYIPPSGHVAGVYARTDNERGVHKAPANTDVRGVLGLERVLSDGQQGPLNLEGVNVLRIFPGSGTVVVWGARTTVDPDVTDWLYVNVRRLMLFIEESIEEGIRWAVFEPNNLSLWQQLKRAIGEFLSRVWRDGALFGDTPEQAYYVRIDEALNPPSVRALGRLYIEIGVAAVRPAEFIIVRIGLWDGGSQVTEG